METRISPQFIARKQKILEALTVPDAEYTDLSPKGSVDEGIRELINQINSMDGVVTTSSCAGRISVFLEGRKGQGFVERLDETPSTEETPVPGGKGMGGKWLYVSHDPINVNALLEKRNIHDLLGLEPLSTSVSQDTVTQRLVRLQFEPMVSSSYYRAYQIRVSALC